MITSVPHEQLAHLSFPDAQVKSVDLDLPARRLALRVDGAWLDSQGASAIGAGELAISGWDHLDVRVYEHEAEQWSKVGFTPLRDICEFLTDASKIILRGFAKDSGLWTEVAAVGDQIHATYTVQTTAG
jgi:hypothetical protein